MDLKRRIILLGVAALAGIIKGLMLGITTQHQIFGVIAENSGIVIFILIALTFIAVTWRYGLNNGFYAAISLMVGIGVGLELAGELIWFANYAILFYAMFVLTGGP